MAEYLGSAVLACAVVGSGIMAERLAAGNLAVALLANTFATVLVLALLIAVLSPVSGAHFNPAVTLALHVCRALPWRHAVSYVIAQVGGCCSGALLANLLFDLPVAQISLHERTGIGQWISEWVATAGLISVVLTSPSAAAASWRVPAWIGAAYWFTSSTSFANPAITIARSLSNTFAGIAPESVPGFLAAQFVGALSVVALLQLLKGSSHDSESKACIAP